MEHLNKVVVALRMLGHDADEREILATVKRVLAEPPTPPEPMDVGVLVTIGADTSRAFIREAVHDDAPWLLLTVPGTVSAGSTYRGAWHWVRSFGVPTVHYPAQSLAVATAASDVVAAAGEWAKMCRDLSHGREPEFTDTRPMWLYRAVGAYLKAMERP